MHPMNARLLKKVETLLELDQDEIRGFDAVLSRIDDAALRREIARFRDEHRRHVDELVAAVSRYGGRVRGGGKPSFFERLLNLRSVTGTVGALKALEDREERIQKRYAELLAEGELPADIASVVRRCRDEERRHLAGIRHAVDETAGRDGIAPGAH